MPIKFNDTEKHILTTKAGFSRQLLTAWEQGKCMPGKRSALIIVEYTGRDLVDVLYGREPGEKPQSPAA